MDNTLRPIDNYFLQQDEPVKSCLFALRDLLNSYNKHITEEWKYAMAFYYYKGKMFCYIRVDRNTNRPYIGIMEGRNIEHPLLLQEDRKRVKVLYIDAEKDIPIEDITAILAMALKFYK
ncbi:MAG: DUF1801 domain-containing protein [Mucilaginibacter sp.]